MRRRRALLSLHDVTPVHSGRIDRALSFLQELGTSIPLALHVVPAFHGRWSLPSYPEFTEQLRDLKGAGAEIILHGFEHKLSHNSRKPRQVGEKLKARFLTADEGEFQGLSYYHAASRLRQGREKLEEALGISPSGFVAPAWLESEETVRALKSLGFSFHEDHLFVYDLTRDRRFFAPALTFTGRSAVRARASVAWAHFIEPILRSPVDVRLALHPVDFDHPPLIEAIERVFHEISRTRDWVSYETYLDLDTIKSAEPKPRVEIRNQPRDSQPAPKA